MDCVFCGNKSTTEKIRNGMIKYNCCDICDGKSILYDCEQLINIIKTGEKNDMSTL